MIKIRKYNDLDFESVYSLFKKTHHFDPVKKSILKEKIYQDPDWNPGNLYLAVYHEKIIGFLLGVKRKLRPENVAYIKLMGVDPAHRRTGAGTNLLQTFQMELERNKIGILRVYDAPMNYFMPGVDPHYTPAICFLEKNGFTRKGESINMEVDLESSDWKTRDKIESLKKHNIEIKRADRGDKDHLFLFIRNNWELWENEVTVALNSDPPSIFIAKIDDQIRAFSAYDGNNRGIGWFGPMGTHPDMRGKGVGSILLYLCLKDIKEQGHKKSIIPWVGPVSFYSHYTGAVITRIFWRFEKKMYYDQFTRS